MNARPVQGLARAASRRWWAVLLAWVALAVGLWLVAPPFSQVATYDFASFLSEDASSVQGAQLVEEGWEDDAFGSSLAVVFVREDGALRPEDTAYARSLVRWMESPEAPEVLGPVVTHLRDPRLADVLASEDGHVMVLRAGVTVSPFSPPAREAVEVVRAHVRATDPPSGLELHTTGTVAVAADQQKAVDTSVGRVHLLSVGLIVAILLWVYRSPIAPLVPLVTIGVSYVVSLALVSLLAQAGMDIASLYQTFSIVVIFGVGTDYCLLLVSRYRDELRLARETGHPETGEVRRRTLAGTLVVLTSVLGASAATVAVGFSAQGLARFGLYRTLGPAMAVAVVVTALAAVTLAPAVMRALGRHLFWPHWDRGDEIVGDEPVLEKVAA